MAALSRYPKSGPAGVNQTFLLGRGPGIRISEPLYRALPSAVRSPWVKHKPPAVYHLDAPDGIYAGMGKPPIRMLCDGSALHTAA